MRLLGRRKEYSYDTQYRFEPDLVGEDPNKGVCRATVTVTQEGEPITFTAAQTDYLINNASTGTGIGSEAVTGQVQGNQYEVTHSPCFQRIHEDLGEVALGTVRHTLSLDLLR